MNQILHTETNILHRKADLWIPSVLLFHDTTLPSETEDLNRQRWWKEESRLVKIKH